MEEIKDSALSTLQKMDFPDPIDKILICGRFGLPKTWAINAFNKLRPICMDGDPFTSLRALLSTSHLSVKDAERLGPENVMLVYRLRDLILQRRLTRISEMSAFSFFLGGVCGLAIAVAVEERDIR